MKRIIKITLLISILSIITGLISFSSCKKDIDRNIAIVKAKIGNYEIASVKYENGELELDESDFPATIPDNYLGHVFDTQAKTGTVQVGAYNSAGECIGEFFKYNRDGHDNWQLRWYAWYIYADRSFTKKGESFDCSFKKGWNVIYISEIEGKYTTQKPSDKDFIWYYRELKPD